MGFRFRKSVKIAPGVRLNASKKGLGISIGGRAGGIRVGPSGTCVRASVPGTGISFSEKVGGKRTRSLISANRSTPTEIKVRVRLDEDTGEVSYTDQNGNALPPMIEREAIRAGKNEVLRALTEAADRINRNIQDLAQLHMQTPNPHNPIAFSPNSFAETRPEEPQNLPNRGILGILLPPIGKRREQEAQRLLNQYSEQMQQWQQAKQHHEAQEATRLARFKAAQNGAIDAMEELLRGRLTALSWPYETIAAFDLINGKTLALDIDLPEIKGLPVKECMVAARGNKLNFKSLSDKRRRGLYLAHIHAIGFRLLGEVFSALPSIETIIISAYSQRIDAATGHESDDYLYSAIVTRESYGKANFSSE